MAMHFASEEDLLVYGKDGYIVVERENGEVLKINLDRFEAIMRAREQLVREALGLGEQ